jgi:ABC-type antimicrobial peptide transport system permease subunit
MARKLAGEATNKELEELEELLREHPQVGYSLQVLLDLWYTKTKGDPEEAESAFDHHLLRLEEKSQDRSAPIQSSLNQSSLNQSAPNQSVPASFPPAITPQPFTQRRHREKMDPWSLFLHGKDILENYFKIAWRSLFRNTGFSAINISGLAIGIASAIVLLLWIRNELSYDQFHKDRDRIYQVYMRGVVEGRTETTGSTPMVMASALKMNYQRQIEAVTRVNWVGAFILSAGDKHLQTYGYLTDPSFLKLFSFPLIKGDPATALQEPHSLVLTEKMAKKLFGDTDPMGQLVRIDSNINFTVTAVMKDLPSNTRFRFEYLVPWSYMKEVGWEESNWGNSNIETYVLLKPGVSERVADNSLHNIIHSHAPDVKNEVFLHPMRKWRLYSEFKDGKIAGGNINFVRMLGIIAGFILLIACINYMNLSTARSIRRAREVGIRKVIGAGKGSLIARFLGESILIAALSGFLALLIVQPGLNWFNKLIQEDLQIPYDNPWFWLSGAGFILFTGLLAGSYPAFYLSAYRPINVLKGYFKSVHSLVQPRKVLVIVQFSFAIAFIICTLIIYRQINFIWQRKAGYDKDKLAFVYIKGEIRKNYEQIHRELINSGVATSITRTNSPITEIWSGDDGYSWKGKDPNNRQYFAEFRTDNDFASTMGLKILAGRDIDIRKYRTDSTAIVLNETAVRRMGFKDPIGQQVRNGKDVLQVVGVIQDFVTGSPFAPIAPVVIQGPKSWFGTITFKLSAGNTRAESIEKLGAILKKYNPDYPFEYYFVDEMYASKFKGEEHVGSLAALFAGMAIFISCLGLFGLAAYMAENRIREIGVRKVLGASVGRITTLLSKDFLVLVMVAFVIASPIAWWCMSKWLQDYPYRVQINGWVFVLTGVLSMVVAGGTVGYQAVRAALANPIKSLRSE